MTPCFHQSAENPDSRGRGCPSSGVILSEPRALPPSRYRHSSSTSARTPTLKAARSRSRIRIPPSERVYTNLPPPTHLPQLLANVSARSRLRANTAGTGWYRRLCRRNGDRSARIANQAGRYQPVRIISSSRTTRYRWSTIGTNRSRYASANSSAVLASFVSKRTVSAPASSSDTRTRSTTAGARPDWRSASAIERPKSSKNGSGGRSRNARRTYSHRKTPEPISTTNDAAIAVFGDVGAIRNAIHARIAMFASAVLRIARSERRSVNAVRGGLGPGSRRVVFDSKFSYGLPTCHASYARSRCSALHHVRQRTSESSD